MEVGAAVVVMKSGIEDGSDEMGAILSEGGSEVGENGDEAVVGVAVVVVMVVVVVQVDDGDGDDDYVGVGVDCYCCHR